MSDKQFVGKTNVVTTKYGKIVKVAFGPQDFEVLMNAKNEKGWVNLEMKDKRDGGVYFQIQSAYTPKAAAPVNDGDDMPF